MAAVYLAGCPHQQPARPAASEKAPAEPRPSVALRILVVNEPELVEAINRLRGEWAERTGGTLSATAKSWPEIAASKAVDADLIVFPSRYLGELCAREWLRPVRPNVLESKDFESDELFPLVRLHLMQWGGQVMALPLGVHLPAIGRRNNQQPGISLLIAGAPDAVSNERIGVLFDAETMKPRITESPFVAALKKLAQSSRHEPFNAPAGERRVPVLGYSDRFVAVTASSRNAASAFKLLAWLASAETSSQLVAAGDGMLPARRSQASLPVWYDAKLSPAERTDSAKQLEDALSEDEFLIIPRIPGIDDYMAALDEAVKEVLDDNAAPHAALEKAAQRWEEITDAHGREVQRRAYLKHLGIDEP